MAKKLSPKSTAVLSLIADGLDHDAILDEHPDLRLSDIREAAREALDALLSASSDGLAEVRRNHPRAYEPWDTEEENRLVELHQGGRTAFEIGARLQRQPSAITSRLKKLGLL